MKSCTFIILTAACALIASDALAQAEPTQPNFGTISVRLQNNGLLVGTIGHIDPSSLELMPVEGATLLFIQNRRLMARAISGPNGELAVRGLSPQAAYSLVARATHDGQEWIVAHGVSVLAPEGGEASAALSGSPAYRLTAARAAKTNLERMAQPSIGLAMVPAGDLGFGSDDDSSAPVLGGHTTGGGGGGGFGGHGGGLAAAALAAAIAIAASDDDDFELATPFRP